MCMQSDNELVGVKAGVILPWAAASSTTKDVSPEQPRLLESAGESISLL